MEQITYGEIPEPVARANARLIAAAPDMLAALRGAMVIIDTLPLPGEASQAFLDVISNRRRAVLAAIAKAEGSPATSSKD